MRTEKPRQYTLDEIREKFVRHVALMVEYWSKRDELAAKDNLETRSLEGLAFSILSAIDGSALGLPKFVLAADPHPDDEEFRRREEKNWYPEAHVLTDISGCLHEVFYDAMKRVRESK